MIPKNFKFKMGRVFPSEEICYGTFDGKEVVTTYKTEYITIVKKFSFKEALECFTQGFWILVK